MKYMSRKIIIAFVILFIISLAHAAEEEKEEHKVYNSSTSLSILQTSGNANEFSLGFDTEQNLNFGKSQLNFKGSVIYAESQGTRDTEFYFSQLNYRYSLELRIYGVASTQLERNVLSGYNYRFSISAGAGYFWIKSKKFEASSEAAFGWSSENNIEKASDSDVSFTFISMSISNSIKIPLSSNSELNHQNIFFFNLKTGDDFRINTISSVSFNISKLFSIKISHQLKYNHSPVPGFKNTDHYILSSLVLKF
jgi:putative salt-induced outer membrane protein YdiY